MTNDQLLDLLVEESAELIQCIAKIKRFGLNGADPKDGKANTDWLIEEMGDVLGCLRATAVAFGEDFAVRVASRSVGKIARSEKSNKKYGVNG